MLRIGDFYIENYEIDERMYTLSRHPYNYGYFTSLTNNNYELIEAMNKWIDNQREYFNNLPLETKSGLLLLQKNPELFKNGFDPLKFIEMNNIDIRNLFEITPSINQINRYKILIQKAIEKSPPIPNTIEISIDNTNDNDGNNFLLFKNIKNSKFVKIKKGTPLICMNSIFQIKNLYLLQIGAVVDTNNEVIISNTPNFENINPIEDDLLLYMNARKETLEESGIDINNNGKLIGHIDYPLYLQKEYCLNDSYNTYIISPIANGIVASGTIFLCRDDKSILLFQRSYNGDYGGTWAGTGGAIGEDSTIIYKTKFIYRTYIFEISAIEKKILKGLDLPRINYEHNNFSWFDYSPILNQLGDFPDVSSFDSQIKVTKFIRTYDSQIPTILNSIDRRIQILENDKFTIYVNSPNTTNTYELLIPSTSYTLWHIKDIL